MKITQDNFKALASAPSIENFRADYLIFLQGLESLEGEAGHSEDKRFSLPSADAAALFNEAHPEDLGVAPYAKASIADLLQLLGK